MTMAVRLFVDFDGTITLQDVGNDVFARFSGGRNQEAIGNYHGGRLSAHDLFLEEAALAGAVSRDELDALIDAEQIDGGFFRFLEFCRARGLEPCILSDGLDYYIDRILRRCGAPEVPRFANHLRLAGGEEGRVTLALEFPAGNPDCGRCASCKRNIMLGRAGDDDVIVYVGEGYSDRCPAAMPTWSSRRSRSRRTARKRISRICPYATFDDVRTRLEGLLARGEVRKRRRAELMRRAAFRAE